MAGPVVLVLLVLLLAAAAVTAVVVVLAAVRGPAPAPSDAARAAVRYGAVVHAVALVLLLAALLVVPALAARVVGPAQGIVLGLAPALAGLTFAATQAVGEATWPRPTGPVRRAPLTRRTARDVAPRPLRAAAWGWAALAAAALVVAGALAADGGRSIERTFPSGSAGSGPFPGWFFGGPLLVAVVVVLVAAEGVLRLVATRPSVADADPAWDLSLRRLSAHRVLRGAQLVLAWTAAGVLGVAGTALRNVGDAVTDDPATASTVHLALGTVALVLAVAAALGGAVLALLPAAPVSGSRTGGTGTAGGTGGTGRARFDPSGVDPAAT